MRHVGAPMVLMPKEENGARMRKVRVLSPPFMELPTTKKGIRGDGSHRGHIDNGNNEHYTTGHQRNTIDQRRSTGDKHAGGGGNGCGRGARGVRDYCITQCRWGNRRSR